MPKAFVFDLDGTLYDEAAPYPAAMDAAARYVHGRFGVEPEAFLAAAKRESDWQFSTHPERPGIHSRFVRFQRVMESFGKPPSAGFAIANAYWDGFFGAMRPRPEIAPLLRDLRAAGYRTGVGTNMTCSMQLRKVEELGLADLFDFIVTSEEADFEKPAPEFFALVAEKAGCPPSEIVFCGDNLNRDARAANAAGMRGVWLLAAPGARAEDAPDVESAATLDALRAFAPGVAAK